ncbi:Os03g0736600, partial [Oryza sativa Japonica Group]
AELSQRQGDEHLEPADQPWRPPGVPGGKGDRPADAGVSPLRRPVDAAEHGRRRGAGARRAVPAVAGADAAPAKQLRRRRARRAGGRRRRRRAGAVPAADARLPAVAPGQERCRGGRPGRRRGRRAAAAAAARAAGGGVVRRGARRAPDRAHRPQDAPDHRVREPHHRERRRPVADRRLRRLLRPRRVPRHRPQRQGQARHAQEPRRLLRPDHRPPAPIVPHTHTAH